MICISQFLLILSLLKTNSASMKLFQTENLSSIQSYDCMYYTNLTARNIQTTPYCIRTNESISLNRLFTTETCGNSGKEWTFRNLKQLNVSQEEVLTWQSGIEMADRYAAYLTTGHEQLANEKICNCSSKTFGKFCEYEFLTQATLEETVQYQYYLKKKYRNGSQLWGNMTCYTTLIDCYFGLRCLTWQNICDGKQQCMYGIDEEHCEELEYNECEENEYRCHDGSCITEDYWLDGEYDCSDKSDEQDSSEKLLRGRVCSLISSEFDCDEATEANTFFACGDGQFVLDGVSGDFDCYNYRLIMFFCEYPWGIWETHPTWTLDNGHCVEKGWLEKNFTDMNETEKCIFYLKCQLTNGANDACDEIIDDLNLLCENRTIIYPSQPIICPYFQTVYNLSNVEPFSKPDYLLLNGSLKCLGRKVSSEFYSSSIDWDEFEYVYQCDTFFCAKSMNIQTSLMNDSCWPASKPSFFCRDSLQCLSKHRLQNGIEDCADVTDESVDQSCFLTNQQSYRFQCSGNSIKCLSTTLVGNGFPECKDYNDERIVELKLNLFEHKCQQRHSIECRDLQSYIRSFSSISTRTNDKIILYRQYCDSFFHLPKGDDERLCNEWKCSRDLYQCLSGHCISVDPMIYHRLDWNCPDATDNIGLFRLTQLSDHNAQILDYSQVEGKKSYLNRSYIHEIYETFPTYCDFTSEYGCLLANVDEPLNFDINRPCINLTQIGDGIIDCYGGLDERNLLTCGKNDYEQRGFDFHCSNDECIPHHRLCKDRCSNHADDLLCVQLANFLSSSCDYNNHIDVCTRIRSNICYSIQIGNYYCDADRTFRDIVKHYRQLSWAKQKPWIYLSEYPSSKIIKIIERIPERRNEINFLNKEENNGREGWICGRGVAIKQNTNNQIQCFCPPSLYGEFCQYYSDRITVITSLDKIPLELLEEQRNIIKILVVLLSNDNIVDHYVFHLPLILSKELDKKFRFNLIHSRPKVMSNSYRVRFEAYNLHPNSLIQFLGVWEYPVHFPFLPSYRLAQVLRFNKNATSIPVEHICKTANPCLHNSTCHTIFNKMKNMSAYYCYCNNQSFGKHCEQLFQPSLTLKCSKHALLHPISSSKFICLCPSHLYGPTCHLNHTCVNNNPCKIDRGKCYPNPDNITQDYICICNKKYFGNQCELNSAMVQINFTDFSFVQMPSKFILSSIIQLCDLDNKTLDFIIREKHVYAGLPPSLTQIYHNDYHLPILGILKLYHKLDLSNDYIADLKQSDHFILYVIPSNVSLMNVTLTINRTNYCPYTPTIFQRNLSNASHLFQFFNSDRIDMNTSTIIFKYHSLCNPPYSLLCFHDDHYYCLCDMYNHAECFRYNLTFDECHGQCRAGGQCIHGDLEDRKDFLCLCPRCYHGSICQHNTELFSFTLETLLTNDLYSSLISIQLLFFSLLIIIPAILFLIGAVNNICCYVTFNRVKPLLVGSGHYLRVASIISQLTLLMLLLKLLHLVLSIKGYLVHHLLNTILCKSLSYLLVCSNRISYWLMGMVAVERVYVTWYLRGTWLKSPRIAKRIIATIILGIIVCDVHELIFYQSIEDPKSLDTNNSTWCVTSYPSGIATFNQVNIILNYILPLLINFLSTIILIVLIIRKRTLVNKGNYITSTTNNQSAFRVYLDLLKKYKELILPPSVTMLPQLFSLPQFILSFSFACQEFTITWQRYLLIIAFFTTYLPEVISWKLYVSPSSFYTEEFRATNFYKKISRWRARVHRTRT